MKKSLFKLTVILLTFLAVILGDILSAVFFPYNRPATTKKKNTFVVSSPTRVHQFIPNATFVYDGAEYHTNSLGFRDREFSVPKPAGTLRMAVLGDSFIEGLAEKQGDTIPKVLERELQTKYKGPVEVMNCGVRGGSPAVYQ